MVQRLCLCSLRKRLDQRTFGRKVASITPALFQLWRCSHSQAGHRPGATQPVVGHKTIILSPAIGAWCLQKLKLARNEVHVGRGRAPCPKISPFNEHGRREGAETRDAEERPGEEPTGVLVRAVQDEVSFKGDKTMKGFISLSFTCDQCLNISAVISLNDIFHPLPSWCLQYGNTVMLHLSDTTAQMTLSSDACT